MKMKVGGVMWYKIIDMAHTCLPNMDELTPFEGSVKFGHFSSQNDSSWVFEVSKIVNGNGNSRHIS